MTTDQPRLASSRLLVAEAFTRARTDTTPDPHDLATWLLEQLEATGWTPPRDLTETVPLAGPGAPEDGPGRQAFRAELARLAARPRLP